ncbi:MAG: FGGY-family carbohydrate kinase, partial [Clostridia bacterium]
DFFKQCSDSEVLALLAKNGDGTSGTDGVYVVPAFTGLGAPYWNQNARGIITGITRNTDRNHIIRATLESLAYSTKDVLICMEKEGLKLNELNVDGGAGNNNFLMQFQADILGCKIIRPVVTESTVMGAVYLCGLGTGAWKSIEEIKKHRKTDRVFSRQISEIDAENLYIGWQNAVKQCTFIK